MCCYNTLWEFHGITIRATGSVITKKFITGKRFSTIIQTNAFNFIRRVICEGYMGQIWANSDLPLELSNRIGDTNICRKLIFMYHDQGLSCEPPKWVLNDEYLPIQAMNSIPKEIY